MKRKLILAAAALGLSSGMQAAHAVPIDIAFIVDQSQSMGTEFGWIPTVISQIDAALQAESIVTSTRYGIAGYMEGAGNEYTASPPAPNSAEYVGLAFVDFTSNVADVTAAATAAGSDLRAATERGYHAADWARSGFSWDTNAVKVMILLTDEAADQGSVIPDAGQGSDEVNLGKLLADDGFLLNVITLSNLFTQWDQAVYDQSSSYKGLFSLNDLRTDAAGFTADFVLAKVGEIKDVITVPAPGTIALLGLGLAGLGLQQRRKAAA